MHCYKIQNIQGENSAPVYVAVKYPTIRREDIKAGDSVELNNKCGGERMMEMRRK